MKTIYLILMMADDSLAYPYFYESYDMALNTINSVQALKAIKDDIYIHTMYRAGIYKTVVPEHKTFNAVQEALRAQLLSCYSNITHK